MNLGDRKATVKRVEAILYPLNSDFRTHIAAIIK